MTGICTICPGIEDPEIIHRRIHIHLHIVFDAMPVIYNGSPLSVHTPPPPSSQSPISPPFS